MPGLKYLLPHVPMLGKGSVLIDLFDAAGLPTGLRHMGNCPKFGLDTKDDKAQLFQSINKAPSLIAQGLKKREMKISLTGSDFSADHMAIVAMSSGKTTVTTAVAAIVAELLISASVTAPFGRYFRTAKMNIDPAVPVVVKQGATTFVLGTDYVVADPVAGLIYIPVSSTLVGATATTIGYSTIVGSQAHVSGGIVPFQLGKLSFIPDPTDGQAIGMDVWRVSLSPNGELGLISDEYQNWTLEGDVLDDTANHPNAPYYDYTFF
jgi:hypothetical protein